MSEGWPSLNTLQGTEQSPHLPQSPYRPHTPAALSELRLVVTSVMPNTRLASLTLSTRYALMSWMGWWVCLSRPFCELDTYTFKSMLCSPRFDELDEMLVSAHPARLANWALSTLCSPCFEELDEKMVSVSFARLANWTPMVLFRYCAHLWGGSRCLRPSFQGAASLQRSELLRSDRWWQSMVA